MRIQRLISEAWKSSAARRTNCTKVSKSKNRSPYVSATNLNPLDTSAKRKATTLATQIQRVVNKPGLPAIVIAVLITASSCAPAPAIIPPPDEDLGTLGEVLTEAGDFTIFLEMVEAYELTSDQPIVSQALNAEAPVDFLNGSEEYTIFAPTDAAFEAYLRRKGSSRERITRWGIPGYWDWIFYHVLDERVPSSRLEGLYFTYLGRPLLVDRSSGIQLIGVDLKGAKLTKTDIEASNGVIHTIDTVLDPPNRLPHNTPPTSDQ